jgi:hypothetical protein
VKKIKPTPRQKELLALLGKDYSLKIIDLEPCIYRQINDRFDIEVSGTLRKRSKIYVYVWNIEDGTGYGAHLTEAIANISSNTELKDTLESIVAKYNNTEV